MGEDEATTTGGSELRGDDTAGTGGKPAGTGDGRVDARTDEADPRVVLVALWRMSRPAQLALIALVYGLGVAMALGRGVGTEAATTAPATVPFGLAALLPIAASVHYANEYADIETDAITDRTPFSGGSGALVETDLSPRLALYAGVTSGIVGLALLGIGVSAVGVGLVDGRVLGAMPAALLVAVLIVGWQYSVGPLELAWNGFGEVTNAALGGVALPLYGYAVVAGRVTLAAVLATLPFAIVVFVNLLETTWPDRAADAAVGKWTLATRWSPERLRLAYGLGSLTAVASVLLLAGRVLPIPVALGTLLPMLGLVPGTYRFTRQERPFPAVMTMVLVAVGMTVGWAVVADLPSAVSPFVTGP